MGWRSNRCQPLSRADVGHTVHAHLTVRPGLGGTPFHGVEAVLALVEKRGKLALRGVPAASVLDNHYVSGFRRSDGIQYVKGYLRLSLPIRGALQQHGVAPSRARPEDIGGQKDTIPHWHRDVLFYNEVNHRSSPPPCFASAQASSRVS